MSTQSIGSVAAQTWPSSTNGSTANGLRQSMNSLDNSLLNGDLSGAQAAFAALQQFVTGVQSAAGTNSAPTSTNSSSIVSQLGQSSSPLGQDMQALSSALSSNDIAGAQKAYAKLQQDMQSAFQANSSQGHHHHHGHKTDADAQSSSASPINALLQSAASTPSTGSTANDLVNALQSLASSNPKVANDLAALVADMGSTGSVVNTKA